MISRQHILDKCAESSLSNKVSIERLDLFVRGLVKEDRESIIGMIEGEDKRWEHRSERLERIKNKLREKL